MSHTYNAKNGTRFHYNSDLSGEVRVSYGDHLKDRVIVPAADLVEWANAVGDVDEMHRLIGSLVFALQNGDMLDEWIRRQS